MNNEKRARQQTLPRHTLLAPLGKRIVAFIIDVALVLVMTIVLYLSASQFIFQSSIYSSYDKLFKEDFNSHLFYYDEESKTRKQYKEEGINALENLFTHVPVPFFLEFAKNKRITGLVYLSSIEIYGKTEKY